MKLDGQGVIAMKKFVNRQLIAVLVFLMLIASGCNGQKEKNQETAKSSGQQAATLAEKSTGEAAAVPSLAPSTAAVTAASTATVAEVDGLKFTKGQFDAEMKRNLNGLGGQMPPEQIEKLKPEIKKQIIDDFVNRTVLSLEAKRLKIDAAPPEISAATEQVKKGLPPGVTLEELLKKMDMTAADFQERLTLGVKINKLVLAQPLSKANPTEKEVSDYYKENKEKFKMPEMVHARHILVGLTAGDNDKTKAEKKAKAEALRKQLLAGADFAGLAAKNSDCPSKAKGGDLGTFPRGQMAKPFEDAAFSQKANVIGPVVTTEFGYHIIQVLAHNEPKVIDLDDKVRGEISKFLKRQKMQDAYTELLKKLRAKATIIVSGQ